MYELALVFWFLFGSGVAASVWHKRLKAEKEDKSLIILIIGMIIIGIAWPTVFAKHVTDFFLGAE